LAEKDDTRPEIERRQLARDYGDRAIRLLRRAISEGFCDTDELRKASRFDSLRSRDEFKTLLAKLESRSK
jgi:hypothetical protein